MGFVQRLESHGRSFRGLFWREKCQQQRVPRVGCHGVGVKQFGGGSRLGVGLGGYDQIEKTSVFPVVIVDWRQSDWLM